jgi:DNA-binding CsgD family transcriptional regulator
MKPYQDKDTIEELYTRQGLSAAEIGALFGVHERTIRINMRQLGVARREGYSGRRHSDETKARMMSTRRAMAGGWSITKEQLEELYVTQRLSTNKIASLVGCTSATVTNLIRRYGIPQRRRGEAVAGERNPTFGRPRSEETKST